MRYGLTQAILLIVCLFWFPQATASGQPSEGTPQGVNKILEQQTSEIQQVKETLEKQRAELAKQNETRHSIWNVYWVPILSPLAAVIAAIGGWLITYFLLKRNFDQQAVVRAAEWERQDKLRQADLAEQERLRKNQEEDRENERTELYLVDALKYFESRTQKCNIGIAFVEAYWDKASRLRETWTAVLANQAIYILTKILEDKNLTLHELDNFERILAILRKGTLQEYQYEHIQEVMSKFTFEIVQDINDKPLKDKVKKWHEELRQLPHA